MYPSNFVLIRGIAADICKVIGRKSIEPGLRKALVDKNHILEDLFEVKIKDMKMKKDKATMLVPKANRTGVSYCYCLQYIVFVCMNDTNM